LPIIFADWMTQKRNSPPAAQGRVEKLGNLRAQRRVGGPGQGGVAVASFREEDSQMNEPAVNAVNVEGRGGKLVPYANLLRVSAIYPLP
jgi:hypothetical protein